MQEHAVGRKVGEETDYPETPLSSLPDAVWADVQAGVPMAAAFALAERRRLRLEEKAAKSNAENKKTAPEGLFGGEKCYFSPSEVRAMSPAQVRANYEKIIYSMQKWN